MLNEFKQFLLRGNVVDLAVGVVTGAAFGSVVSALVSDIFTPFIGAIVRLPDFSSVAFTINGSQFMVGHFLNTLISFLLISAVIFFFVVKPMNVLMNRNKKQTFDQVKTKKCTECFSDIPLEAKRCPYCTQVVK